MLPYEGGTARGLGRRRKPAHSSAGALHRILRGKRILLCRKNRDTSRLILPGGRIEPGESELECVAREIREELGAATLGRVEYLGTSEDRTSMDDPNVLKGFRITVYRG